MDNGVVIVILVLVILVIGVNGVLFLSLRRGATQQFFKLWKNAASKARNPWQQENENLETLSRLVSELKQSENSEPDS